MLGSHANAGMNQKAHKPSSMGTSGTMHPCVLAHKIAQAGSDVTMRFDNACAG